MKQPCRECPFRKNSRQGYLGPYKNSRELFSIIQADIHYPCHTNVQSLARRKIQMLSKAEADIFSIDNLSAEASKIAHHCVGSLAMANSMCKLSRDEKIRAEQQRIGKRDDVFENIVEMEKYHDKKEE